MVHILPLARFVLNCAKSPAATVWFLSRSVLSREHDPDWRGRSSFEYVGTVGQDSFTIKRNLNYGNRWYPIVSRFNAFVPIINGRLEPDGDGTRLVVTAVFGYFVTLASLLFCAILTVAPIMYVREAAPRGRVEWGSVLAAVVVLLAFYLWQMISLNHEVNKAKEFLLRVAGADAESQ